MTKRTVLITLTALVALVVTISIVMWLYKPSADTNFSGVPSSSGIPSTSDSAGDQSEGYLPSLASKNGELVKVTVNPYGKLLPQTEKPLSPDDPGWLSAPPKGLEWQTTEYYLPMLLGVSTSDGPTGFAGDIPTGFARTPQGAVLATIAINSAQIGGATCRYAVKNLFYPPDSPARGEQRCTNYDNFSYDDDDIPNAPPTAIEIRSYDGTAAAIYLWFLHPEEPRWRQYVRREDYVVWVDGQWKLDKRIPGGRKRLRAESIPTTATRWGDGK